MWLAWNCDIVLLGALACGSIWALHGTMADPGSCTAATSMLAEPAATSGGVVTVDAASIRGSWLSESIFEGMITDTAMVIAVMATAAIPKAMRGTEGSYWFIAISSFCSCLLYR